MTSEHRLLDINPESPSIQTHLGILQGVVQRMAMNSSSCKAWCVALVSAILVVIADKGNSSYAWIAVFPIVIFAALDIYYLALEKAFRAAYNDFVGKLHRGTLTEEDLYSVMPKGDMSELQLEAAKSFSVWGLYASLAVLVALAGWMIIG